MSCHTHPHPARRLFLCAALLLSSGVCHAALGQIPNFGGGQEPRRQSNPSTNYKRPSGKRPDARAKKAPGGAAQPTPAARPDEKEQAVERALELGNQARDAHDYEKALAHYETARQLNPQEARAHYGMGNLYSDLYCQDSAIEAYRKAIKHKADYLEAHVGLGNVYLAKERLDEAAAQFKEALRVKPHHSEAHIGLGHVYAKKQQYREAVDEINLILKADPPATEKERAAAHYALGAIYFRQQKQPEAIAAFEEAVRLDPDFAVAYLNLGNAQLATAFSKLSSYGFTSLRDVDARTLGELHASAKQAAFNMERARERKYNHPNLHISLATALAHQLHFDKAVGEIESYFAEVRELKEKLPPVAAQCGAGFDRLRADGLWYAGFLFYLESQFAADRQRSAELLKQAAGQYKEAVKLRPDYASAYGMLGAIYSGLDNHAEAVGHYKNALLYSTDEDHKTNIHRSLASNYTRLKRTDEALEHIREAIRRDPTKPEFYETLASIYVGQGKLDETIEALEKASGMRKEPPNAPGPYHYLGSFYAIRYMKKGDEKDFAEAIRLLKKASEMRPRDHYYHHALAMTYKAHSDAEEALASYRKAAEYDPYTASYYYDVADIYSNLKHNQDAAVENLKKAIEIKQDYAEAYRFLGVVYYRKENRAEAIKHLSKAIELDSKNLSAYGDLAHVYRKQKDYPEAIKWLTRATELLPTEAEPHADLAATYELMDKDADAARHYEEAANRLKPDDADNKNLYLGRAARLRGRFEEAIGYFRKLSAPKTPGRASYEVGLTHVAGKNKEAALEQHAELVRLKSPLAEELLQEIRKMK